MRKLTAFRPTFLTLLASGLLLLAIVCTAICLWFVLLIDSAPQAAGTSSLSSGLASLVLPLSFALVGGLIATQRSRNLIGWSLLLAGVFLVAGENVLRAYAELALLARPDLDLPYGVAAAAISGGAWTGLMASVFFLILLFPTGRIPSRRWRPASILALLFFALVWVGIATSAKIDPPFESFKNPLRLSNADEENVFIYPLILYCLVCVGVATVDLVIRAKRSQADEREQYKWLAFAATALVISLPVSKSAGFGLLGLAGEAMLIASLLALPLAVGIAVFRYRLYDIDLIINQALVYGFLTALLAGLYSACITLSKLVFEDATGQTSETAVVLTTLVLAATFTPLKSRLQKFVDRYFGQVHDPVKALKGYGDRLKALLLLDPAENAREFLNQTVEALTASGGRLQLVVPESSHLISEKGDAAEPVVAIDLEASGRVLGTLLLAGRLRGPAYTSDELEALKATAALFSRSMAILQGLGSDSDASSRNVSVE